MTDDTARKRSWAASDKFLRGFICSLAGVLGFCALSIVLIDKPLALFIRNDTDPEIQRAFLTITELGKAEIYIILALLLFIVGRALFVWTAPRAACLYFDGVARLGTYIIASLALSAVVIHTLKLTLGRARPRALFREDTFGFDLFAFDTSLNSFPSGHSQTIWAVMVPIAVAIPKLRILALGFAALVALSRVMVSAHFLSDMVMGSFIGIVSALYLHQNWFRDVVGIRFPEIKASSEAFSS